MKSEGKKITVLVQIRISNWSKNGTENVCWDEWLVVVAKPWHAKTCYANLKRQGNSKRPESLILISFVKVFTFLMQQHFSWVNQTIFQVLEYSEDDYWGSRQCQWTGGGTFGQVERGFSTWDVYGELNDNLIISCSDAQHILERLWLSLGLAASWAHGKRTKWEFVLPFISEKYYENIIKVIQMVRQSPEDNLWRLNLGWVSAEELATAPRCQSFSNKCVILKHLNI